MASIAAAVLTVLNLVLSYKLFRRRRFDVELFGLAVAVATFDAIAIGLTTGSGVAAAFAMIIPVFTILVREMHSLAL